jgi:hypothetical protein
MPEKDIISFHVFLGTVMGVLSATGYQIPVGFPVLFASGYFQHAQSLLVQDLM